MAWNFNTKHVQSYPGLYAGKDYISSESIVLCAVPGEDQSTRSDPNTSPAT
jgi:hypothetical protein